MNNSDEQYRRQCLRRHYEKMDKSRALNLISDLSSNAKKTIFKKRINYAKGYKFI